VIEVKDLWYKYPGEERYVVRGVTFSFKEGILSITGPYYP